MRFSHEVAKERLTAGRMISGASRSDDAHAIFGAQRIRCLLLSGGIVAPHFVREEPAKARVPRTRSTLNAKRNYPRFC